MKDAEKPYKDVLSFPETGKVSLFKKRKYQVSGPLEIHLLRMRPLLCILDTEGHVNLISANVLNRS